MKVIDCVQGTTEWHRCRLGIPTASAFKKIITSAKMLPSKSADGYINTLVSELFSGYSDETFQTDLMMRGHELEEEAVHYYEFETERDVERVGFCLEDEGRFGCSPDGLLEAGGLEIKCCSSGVHVGYLLREVLPTEYRLQVLGNLLVTGRDWWDFMSYHPDIPPLIVRTIRSDVLEPLSFLKAALIQASEKIELKKQVLINKGLTLRHNGLF